MRISVLWKRWDLLFVPEKDLADTVPRKKAARCYGDCDSPDERNKQIRIAEDLTGEVKMETVIHELLHAGDWGRSEEYVEQHAKDIARVLWRLGYREIEESN